MRTDTSATIGHLLTGLAIAVTIALAVSGLVYNSYSSAQNAQNATVEKLETKLEANNTSMHRTDVCITAIQVDIGYIKKSIEDSNKVQEKILDKLNSVRLPNKGD
jgi:uncharacterized protein HemX